MSRFLERLRQGILLCDGAMGTMLAQVAGGRGRAPEELNLSMPNKVAGVHKAYIEAGAQVIQTNTFGGNRIRLARAGLAAHVRELNHSGASLAKDTARDQALVGGSVGPTGGFLEPLGELSFEEVKDAFAQQVAALAEGGVDLIVVETMSALEEARAAIEGAKAATSLPIVCTMTFEANLHTMMGVTPEQAACSLLDWGADVVGANCGCGPQQTEGVVRRMQEACPHALLAVQPNSGLPRLVNDRTVYDLGPEAFAAYVRCFAALGVRLLGACCGSTPAYIEAMADMC
ncbi:MAG: homocysteine S-methyltransferase family protein [Candidatus Binatia bacterium]